MSHSETIGQVLVTGSERVTHITGAPWTLVRGVQTEAIPLMTGTGDTMTAGPAAGGMRRRADMRVMAVAGDQEVRHRTVSTVAEYAVNLCSSDSRCLCAN